MAAAADTAQRLAALAPDDESSGGPLTDIAMSFADWSNGDLAASVADAVQPVVDAVVEAIPTVAMLAQSAAQESIPAPDDPGAVTSILLELATQGIGDTRDAS